MNYFINKNKENNQKILRRLSTNNPKKYWKFLNSLKPKTKDAPSPSIEEFYNHFKNVNSNSDNENDTELNTEQINNSNESLNMTITESEINKCINNLQNSKTPSQTDNILNEYIKSTKNLLLPLYLKLFNSVLDTGFIPDTWLEGTIIPIYKNKGDPKDPNNYRPITILSCLGKLFTSILNNRLTTFLEENNILNENQAGFRKHYSCSDHIFTLHALINILKRRKQKLFVAYVDFSAAFDKIWRFGLWTKLLQNDINGKLFKVIFNMYNSIKSRVSQNGNLSAQFMSECGVRQGENLSPILFSIYLNDLQAHMQSNGSVGIELGDPLNETIWLKLLLLLYADDTIIVSDSPVDFQNSLNLFNDYCNEWKLKVNMSKTKVIIFGARNTSNFLFKLGEENIEITDRYHYLGVTFSSNGSFLNARKHVVQQATKAMYLLFNKSCNADLPIDLTIKLFDHTVLPILTYGSEIFGFENIDIIEKVHNNFLRRITKARKSTPMYMIYGELGRFPLSINIYSRMIAFWNRLLIGKEQKLSFQIYKYMLNQNNSEYKWVKKIKDILNSVGRTDLWLNQHEITQKNIHMKIKQCLIDQYKQSWNAQLTQSNKGLIYKSFKTALEFEPYFNLLPLEQSLLLFKFRSSNFKLPVETGRWDGTLFQERICNLCTRDEIGSERHYLLSCEYFRQPRNLYLNNLILTENELCFKQLLCSNSETVLKSICAFLKVVLKSFR